MSVNNLFLLGIDGAGRSVLNEKACPHLHAVAKDGVLARNVYSVFPTITAQVWGTMFTSLMPKQTGYDNENIRYTPHDIHDEKPTVFRIIHSHRPSWRLGSFCAWPYLNVGLIEDIPGCVKETAVDDLLVKRAAAFIRESDNCMVFLHLDEMDDCGHAYGYFSETYMKHLGNLDRNIGVIIDAIKAAGKYDDSLILITTDHGGGGLEEKNHGSNMPRDMEIFLIAKGGDLPKGEERENVFSVLDFAPMILRELQIPIPEGMLGNPDPFQEKLISP